MDAFLSYAHEDAQETVNLRKHTAVLRREGLISIWHDREILPGEPINRSINEAIESSSLILLLISPDFINSDYCMGREMKRALELHNEGSAKLVPIICRPCDWKGIEELSDLKALPTDAKPIVKWENKDEAWADVVTELRRLIQSNRSAASNSVQSISTSSVMPRNRKETRRLRVRREFTDNDINNFKEEVFKTLRNHFQQSIDEFNSVKGVQGIMKFDETGRFQCTIVNHAYKNTTVHIMVKLGNDHMQNCAVCWLFDMDTSEESMEGAYEIKSNGYNLYLKLILSPASGYIGDLNPGQAADLLWTDFLKKARIDYE